MTEPPHSVLRAAGLLLAIAPLTLTAAAAVTHSASSNRVLRTHEQAVRAHGYLGIEFHDASDEQIAAVNAKGQRGAEVVMVDHDGPAGKAGLQPRDIVLSLDGKPIANAEDLRRRIRDSAPGRVIHLAVNRLGQPLTLTARLANREDVERSAWQQHLTVPSPQSGGDLPDGVVVERYTFEAVPAAPPPAHSSHAQSFISGVLHSGPYTGLSLETMEPQLAAYFGAPENTGLLVHGVEANSPAAHAGLHAGDIILRVDATGIASISDWNRRLRASSGHPVHLTILREHREQNLTLQPELKKHSELLCPGVLPASKDIFC